MAFLLIEQEGYAGKYHLIYDHSFPVRGDNFLRCMQ
jgi:hypothetical protein